MSMRTFDTMNAAEILHQLQRRAVMEGDAQRAVNRCARAGRQGPLGALLNDCAADRVRGLQQALWHAGLDAVGILADGLLPSGSAIIVNPLVDICSDLALVWGGAALLSPASQHLLVGCGHPPSAQAGTSAEALVANWMFEATRLPRPNARIDAAVAEALRRYERAVDEAWGPSEERPLRSLWKARPELARGHVVLASALIAAWDDDIASTPVDAPVPAPLLEVIRCDERLGSAAARWLAAHTGALAYCATSPRAKAIEVASAARNNSGAPSSPFRQSLTRSASIPPAPRVKAIANDPMHWIEIELIGEDANGIAGEECLVVEPTGREWRGRTDVKGIARIEGVESGQLRVSFPRLDAAAWQKAQQ